MTEKAPDIIAWLAMIDAATATTNVGQYNGSVKKHYVLYHIIARHFFHFYFEMIVLELN